MNQGYHSVLLNYRIFQKLEATFFLAADDEAAKTHAQATAQKCLRIIFPEDEYRFSEWKQRPCSWVSEITNKTTGDTDLRLRVWKAEVR